MIRLSRMFDKPKLPGLQEVQVTITGTGDSADCFVQWSNTDYYEPAYFTVNAGDTMYFFIHGGAFDDNSGIATVKINNQVVFSNPDTSTKSYAWTVPSDITKISIVLGYTISTSLADNITVTTS